jgi:transposase
LIEVFAVASRLVSDEVWERIRTLLPERPPRSTGGRPPIGDREVLTGVLFVLKTGIPWEDLPEEMGCGCGMTCLRRLRQWQESGIWHEMREIFKLYLRDASRYDWSRARDGEQQPFRPLNSFPDGELELASEESIPRFGE